jgi:cytochrome c oxidase subunit 4
VASDTENEHGHEKSHPGPRTYVIIGALLTAATALEVWIFYWNFTPAVIASLIFFTSIFKFVLVVGYYMHLKFDDRRFLALFAIPFFIALIVFIALLALFSSLTR